MSNIGRKFLTDHGVPDDQLDAIMNEINTTISNRLTGYTPQSEVQAQIDAALKAVKQPDPIDPKTTKEYLELQSENDKLRTIGGVEFSEVLPQYRDFAYSKLDRGEKAKPIPDQLNEMRGNYGEIFSPKQQEPKPTFGAPVEGSMPKGETGAVKGFTDAWGFIPKTK